jgi:hypothetical protein
MAISSPDIGGSGGIVCRLGAMPKLFITAFLLSLTSSVLGTLSALLLAGPVYWLAGSLAGGGLSLLVACGIHLLRRD